MNIEITIVDDKGGVALRDLHKHLLTESSLRSRITAHQSSPRPGELGGWLDVLSAAVGPGGAISILIAAIAAWIVTRRAPTQLNARETNTGAQAQIDSSQTNDPQEVEQYLTMLLNPESNA